MKNKKTKIVFDDTIIDPTTVPVDYNLSELLKATATEQTNLRKDFLSSANPDAYNKDYAHPLIDSAYNSLKAVTMLLQPCHQHTIEIIDSKASFDLFRLEKNVDAIKRKISDFDRNINECENLLKERGFYYG
jgi:hypothetical protein